MRELCGIYNSSLLYLINKDTCEKKNFDEILN